MLTFYLKDVLKDKTPDFQFHNIYLVRENDVVFYIGQAADAPERIKQHFGVSFSLNSVHAFADLILQNNPNSKRWYVDFFTVDDCRKIVGTKNLPKYKHKSNQPLTQFPFSKYTKKELIEINKQAHECRLVDDAEREMIRQLRPCFNGTYNENPGPLPKKYQKQQHEAAIRRHKTFHLGFGENL